MADRLEDIAMDTKSSIQEHASAEANIVEAATAFLGNDVNHWLETSHIEHIDIPGPTLTPRNRIISRQEAARRRSIVRGLVLPSI